MVFRIAVIFSLICSLGLAEEETQRQKTFSLRQKIAKTAKATVGKNADPLKLHEAPIYRYHEIARGFHDGTTWMWQDADGRPAMVLNLSGKDTPLCEFISLTNSPLSCSVNEFKWMPREAGWKPKAIPNAMEPANKKVARKLQMRAMAKKFTSYLIDSKSQRKAQLRMLPEPIYRYKQETETSPDGALFAFVRDGDLEVILAIEAETNPDTGKSRWVFDCDRVAISEQHVSYEDQEVWSCPRGKYGVAKDQYCVRAIPIPANSDGQQ